MEMRKIGLLYVLGGVIIGLLIAVLVLVLYHSNSPLFTPLSAQMGASSGDYSIVAAPGDRQAFVFILHGRNILAYRMDNARLELISARDITLDENCTKDNKFGTRPSKKEIQDRSECKVEKPTSQQ